jgi:hypothetical protein
MRPRCRSREAPGACPRRPALEPTLVARTAVLVLSLHTRPARLAGRKVPTRTYSPRRGVSAGLPNWAPYRHTLVTTVRVSLPGLLSQWNWPFPADSESMPRFPCQWSVKAENGCNRPSVQSAKVPIALGPATRSLDLDEAPEGSPGPPHSSKGSRGYRADLARQTRPNRPAIAPAIPGWALALTRALFRRGGAHARCGTHGLVLVAPFPWRSRSHI